MRWINIDISQVLKSNIDKISGTRDIITEKYTSTSPRGKTCEE